MPYNYLALDSFEFELLACDVVAKMSRVKLSCYAPGKDGGIDASDYKCDDSLHPHVIVQAKRWGQTSIQGKLVPSAKKLADRLISNSVIPEELYLVVASPLSLDMQARVQSELKCCGAKSVTVIDSVKLDEFLDEEENRNIVRKHFKLWLAGTGVLQELYTRDVYVDSEVFLHEARSMESVFIQTSLFDYAVDCLSKRSVLLITGVPGTGKTMLTRMLALFAQADGYKVLSSSCNDCSGLKKALSPDDAAARELIVLDDFLGQRCLDVEIRGLREIRSLARFVEISPNRRLVINSRLSILNEAKHRDGDFSLLADRLIEGAVMIDTAEMSLVDKRRILLSNLRFSRVPREYLREICKPSRQKSGAGYIQICQHANFSPRVIEYCSRADFVARNSPDGYLLAILDALSYPEQIWRDEFEMRLTKLDRLLLLQQFSLSDGFVSEMALRRSFLTRISCLQEIDSSVDIFSEAVLRLNRSLLKVRANGKENELEVANPSINDFLSGYIKGNDIEAAHIVENATYVNQLWRMAKYCKCELVTCALEARICDDDVINMPCCGSKVIVTTVSCLLGVFVECPELIKQSNAGLLAELLLRAGSETAAFVEKSAAANALSLIADEKKLEELPRVASFLVSSRGLSAAMNCVSAFDAEKVYGLFVDACSIKNKLDYVESGSWIFELGLEQWVCELAYDLAEAEAEEAVSLFALALPDYIEDEDALDDELEYSIREHLKERVLLGVLEDYADEVLGSELFKMVTTDMLETAIEDAIDQESHCHSVRELSKNHFIPSDKARNTANDKLALKRLFEEEANAFS